VQKPIVDSIGQNYRPMR